MKSIIFRISRFWSRVFVVIRRYESFGVLLMSDPTKAIFTSLDITTSMAVTVKTS